MEAGREEGKAGRLEFLGRLGRRPEGAEAVRRKTATAGLWRVRNERMVTLQGDLAEEADTTENEETLAGAEEVTEDGEQQRRESVTGAGGGGSCTRTEGEDASG